MKFSRLAVTCGGTGGHFYPGLAVAREFIRQGGEALLVLGGRNSAAQAEEAASHQVNSAILPLMPPLQLKRPWSAWGFWRGARGGKQAAQRAFAEFRPDALLAMGSFASLPAVQAAWKRRLPVYLHDGNAHIGRANRYFSRKARLIGLAFPPVNAEKLRCPWDVVGMPLRPELLATDYSREEALQVLNRRFSGNLTPDRQTILIFGGSQGARTVNLAFARALLELGLRHDGFQVIHLAGRLEYELMRSRWDKANFPVLLLPSLDDMALAYRAADLVVSRSGGSSVAELACFRKFAILVPYPFAAENHQYANAEYLAKGETAIIVDNDQCECRAGALLEKFLEDPLAFTETGAAAAHLARPDAARDLLRLIARDLEAAGNNLPKRP